MKRFFGPRILHTLIFCLAALSLFSCEQIFTWPALDSLARPPSLPADMSLVQATVVAERALDMGDRELAAAVLPILLERLSGLEDLALTQSSGLCVDLALLESGISGAASRAALINMEVGEGTATEAQQAAFEAARASVSLSDSALQALALLSDDVGSAADFAFAGAALALSTLDGRLVTDLTPEELDAIHEDPFYVGGQLYLMMGLLMNEEEGGDPSILSILTLMVDF